MLMERNRKILFFILYYLIWISIFQRMFFSFEILVFVPDLLIFYVSYCTYKEQRRNARRNIKAIVGRYITNLMTLLLIITLMVYFMNQYSLFSYIWGIRMIVRYPFLAWSIYMNSQTQDIIKYKRIIINAFFINVGFCILQFFTGARGDLMSCTMIVTEH